MSIFKSLNDTDTTNNQEIDDNQILNDLIIQVKSQQPCIYESIKNYISFLIGK